jgi:hypothetical protein
VYVPSSELGLSHTPQSPARVPLHPEPTGEGQTRLRVSAVGGDPVGAQDLYVICLYTVRKKNLNLSKYLLGC